MIQNNVHIRVMDTYTESTKANLMSLIPQLGSNINFDDNIWICDKKIKSPGHTVNKYTLYFKHFPIQYQDILKYYVLSEKVQISTLSTRLSYLAKFFKYLEEIYDSIRLDFVDRNLINNFQLYLSHIEGSKSWKQNVWSAVYRFFKIMNGWDKLPVDIPISSKNPWTRTFRDHKIDDKYIPQFIAELLDHIYKNEIYPLHQRLIYWILRSIPSRVSEVTGMYLDCLKPYGNNYVLFIPTWKQNGGNFDPEVRAIHIKDEGHGKYLLDLIRQQQKVSKGLQKFIDDDKKGMLFTNRSWRFDHAHYKKDNEIRYITQGSKVLIAKPELVRHYFTSICKINNVRDEYGNYYKITSHQLRHNGITDRLYEGFSLLNIRDMTGHKGNAMIFNSYYHIQPTKSKELQNKIIESKKDIAPEASNAPIYFRGRILNMNEETEKRLLMNPRAYKISHGKQSLGICSDITSCKSGIFECLACEYFVPNADDLDYFESQILEWKKRVNLYNNQIQARENAEYNFSLHKAIVRRIKATIGNVERGNKNEKKAKSGT